MIGLLRVGVVVNAGFPTYPHRMALVDLAPILATLGTLASSGIGIYFDRSRRREQADEPAVIEAVAAEAAASVTGEPSSGSAASAPSDTAVVAHEQIAAAVAAAVRRELDIVNKRTEQSAMKVNIAFFVAGVLASIAVTLYVHPL